MQPLLVIIQLFVESLYFPTHQSNGNLEIGHMLVIFLKATYKIYQCLVLELIVDPHAKKSVAALISLGTHTMVVLVG
jgi:hypothetical protein